MRIVITDEPICEFLKDGTIDCALEDLPRMRAALFSLSLMIDEDVLKINEQPDAWLVKETKRLFEETLKERYGLEDTLDG